MDVGARTELLGLMAAKGNRARAESLAEEANGLGLGPRRLLAVKMAYLEATGRLDEGFAVARQLAEGPDGGQGDWFKYTELLARAGRRRELVEALRAACRQFPFDGIMHQRLTRSFIPGRENP